jgi:2,5-dichloro-2,5-cyclohexadiene-1,4-diol dehydrogenase 1
MYELKDKSIIVTGGGSGMGRATASIAAKAGAKVTVADLNGESAAETAAMIQQAGGHAQSIKTDISREADVVAMVALAVKTYGRLDAAGNCAGRPSHSKTLLDLSLDEWNAGIAVNLTGAYLCLKHEITAMLKSGGGSLVVVSSTSAIKAYPTVPEYTAAKAGILGLVRSAAYEYGKQGIRVNGVLPGTTDTPMYRAFMDKQPHLYDVVNAQQLIGRVGQPEELGQVICFLMSSASSYITGMNIPVDGGQTAC